MLIRSREEDPVRIVFRASLRVANDTRTVTARLYEYDQVKYLQSSLKQAELSSSDRGGMC
jgi:hypothetical protein